MFYVKWQDSTEFFGEGVDTCLKTCPGCPEVEILADYGDRAGFFVAELWESPEVHSEQSSASRAPKGLIFGRRAWNLP